MSFMNIFLYIILPLIVAGYFYVKKKFSYFEDNGIPHIKPTSWILGNMGGVGTEIHFNDFLMKLYEETKGKDVICGFYGMFMPTLIATDLELIKLISVKDFNNFTDRGMYINEENEPITGHMFSLSGEKWRYLRNKLSPVFTSGKIKSMYSTISAKGEGFIQAIEKASKSGSVEMKNITNRFTIDVVASCAFGMESNTQNGENSEIISIFRKIFGEDGLGQFQDFCISIFPRLSKFFNMRMFHKSVQDFFDDVVGGTINYREANKIERNDFLNMLIQLKNKGSIDGEFSKESRKLTMNECIAQAFIFFFAGGDSSSTAISFAIAELALHEEIQEKLRNEINEVTSKHNHELTYDNLHEMPYLNQVMNESLRKYPPAFITMRTSASDYKIPGSKHVLKKGTQIFIPNMAIHHDDRYWKNPSEFDPDRFTAEEIAKRPNFAFLPFGEGPRNCIGMRFAQVNVKFAIATVVKNFKMTMDTNKTIYPFTLNPKNQSLAALGGIWINFEKI